MTLSVRKIRASYAAMFQNMVTRYVQCVRCDRVAQPGGTMHTLHRAGWTWKLGIGTLRWICPDHAENA